MYWTLTHKGNLIAHFRTQQLARECMFRFCCDPKDCQITVSFLSPTEE